MNEKTLVQTIEKPHFRFFLSQRKILPTRVLEFPADCATVNRGKSIGHRFLEENRSGRRIVGELNFQTSHGRACRPEWNEFSRPHRDREWEKRGRKLEWIDNGFRLSLCGRHERGREFLVASTIAPTYRRHLVMFNLSAIRQPVDVWFDGLSRGTRSSATINVNIGRDFLEIEECIPTREGSVLSFLGIGPCYEEFPRCDRVIWFRGRWRYEGGFFVVRDYVMCVEMVILFHFRRACSCEKLWKEV